MADVAYTYALTLEAKHVSTSAFYQLTPTSNLTISQGNATITPTAASMTMVSVLPQELQIEAPPGTLQAGIMILTSAPVISGDIEVSPAVNVPVVLTVYGANAEPIGQMTINPGVTSQQFAFNINPGQSIAAADASGVLKGLAPAR